MASLSDATFDKVLQSSAPFLVMFWQRDCAPCKALMPVLMEIARERPGIRFALMNSRDNPKTSAHYGITACPTMVAVAGGKMLGRWKGAAPKEQVTRWIDRTLDAVNA